MCGCFESAAKMEARRAYEKIKQRKQFAADSIIITAKPKLKLKDIKSKD